MGIQSSRRALPAIVLAVALSACSFGSLRVGPAPKPTAPPPTATRRPRPTEIIPSVTPTIGPQVNVQGATFYFDPALGIATGGPVPADGGDVGSLDWMLPARFEFTISNYPLTRTEITPRIVVFPIAPLAGFNPTGAAKMKALAALLQAKTDPQQITGPIPQMTNPQDREMFHARVSYLNFKNGTGIRFITQYASDLIPISNYDLIYHFTGITSDGTYAVGVLLPLSQKALIANEDSMTDQQAADMLADFTKYLTDAVDDLNIADDSSFNPTLTQLDKLSESFQVTATTAPLVTAAPEDATPTYAPQVTPTPEFYITPAPTQ